MTTGQKLIAKDPYIIREDGKPRFTVGKEYIAEPLEGFRLFKVVTNLRETYHFGYHELETYFKDASQPEPMPAPSFGTWYSIESAPKDGNTVLIYEESEGIYLGYYEDDKNEDENAPCWTSHEVSYRNSKMVSPVHHPTHWTPLPELPKE